jgi:hypothetical protein
VDVGGELPLDDLQQLVARAKQADHGALGRDHDPDLGPPVMNIV